MESFGEQVTKMRISLTSSIRLEQFLQPYQLLLLVDIQQFMNVVVLDGGQGVQQKLHSTSVNQQNKLS